LEAEISILPFQKEYQNDIDEMMESIALEFKQNILTENYKKIIELAELQNCKFWVAIVNKKVVGTIGLVELENQNAEIKKMFVSKSFRGQGISKLLLQTLTNWTMQNKFKHIHLGTMAQFEVAQRFYEKNGFKKISKFELPKDFFINPLDSIFYTKQIE
jgi:RimJ/RimL family protein N-acetyltransferase